MNILFISSHIDPFELPIGGSAQRTNLLLRACAEIANIDVVAFKEKIISNISNCQVIYCNEGTVNQKKETRLHKLFRLFQPWNPYATFPQDNCKTEIVHKILKEKDYDFIVIRYIPKVLECGLLDYADKLVIDVDDLPSDAILSLSENAKTFRNRVWLILSSEIAKWNTKQILSKIKFSFFSNPSQIRFLNSAYLPNVPFYQNYTCPDIDFKRTHNRLFFIGDLDYFPNYLGIDYFLKNIYLQIQLKTPDVEFNIAGRITNDNLKSRWESYKGVKVLGFVDDLVQEYIDSKVVVVPIYQGGGTNIKLLEALQMNRACVVSEFATRGFKDIFENHKEYLIAKNDNEFIQFVVELLTDKQKNRTLAYNGCKKVKQFFSYSVFSNVVKCVLLELQEN